MNSYALMTCLILSLCTSLGLAGGLRGLPETVLDTPSGSSTGGPYVIEGPLAKLIFLSMDGEVELIGPVIQVTVSVSGEIRRNDKAECQVMSRRNAIQSENPFHTVTYTCDVFDQGLLDTLVELGVSTD